MGGVDNLDEKCLEIRRYGSSQNSLEIERKTDKRRSCSMKLEMGSLRYLDAEDYLACNGVVTACSPFSPPHKQASVFRLVYCPRTILSQMDTKVVFISVPFV